MNDSLAGGCTYFTQDEHGNFVTGDHYFEEDGMCFNCGAKQRDGDKKEQLPIEVVEQGVTANV